MNPVYRVGHFLSRLLLAICFRSRRFRPHPVPDGPLLIIANHQSFLDPPLIGDAFDRPLSFMAREGLFRNTAFAWLIRTVGAYPIDQSKGDTAAIRGTLKRLEEGGAVLIFPEGSRSEDGSQIEYKRGIALLLKRSRVPVLPVAVEGCFDAWPRRRAIPSLFRHRIAVRIGKTIEHDDLMADGADRALERLRSEVESLRQDLRSWMSHVSHGRMPRA